MVLAKGKPTWQEHLSTIITLWSDKDLHPDSKWQAAITPKLLWTSVGVLGHAHWAKAKNWGQFENPRTKRRLTWSFANFTLAQLVILVQGINPLCNQRPLRRFIFIQKINRNLVLGELPDRYKNYPNINKLALSFTIPRTLFAHRINCFTWYFEREIKMCQVL
jgi:hypothetical protein